MEPWQLDWKAFVTAVGDCFDHGMTDAQVTECFCERPVFWEGRILENRLEHSSPGLALEMSPVHLRLRDGRTATVDYLFLAAEERDLERWREVRLGELVQFETMITPADGLFGGIQWSALDNGRGVILFGTHGAIPRRR